MSNEIRPVVLGGLLGSTRTAGTDVLRAVRMTGRALTRSGATHRPDSPPNPIATLAEGVDERSELGASVPRTPRQEPPKRAPAPSASVAPSNPIATLTKRAESAMDPGTRNVLFGEGLADSTVATVLARFVSVVPGRRLQPVGHQAVTSTSLCGAADHLPYGETWI